MRGDMRKDFFLLLLIFTCLNTFSQKAEKLMAKMTLKEKVGQLFMVAAYSNRGEEHVAEINDLITESKIGGLIYFQGGPHRQLNQLKIYQDRADVPLMVSMDAEWGVAMRLDSTISYPRQMSLGAITDVQLVRQFGAQVAKECKALGIHMNLAPVVDVNNNPKNPVIGNRSFGEDPFQVSKQGQAYLDGLNDEGVMGCFKHFPGHGDTDKDSHLALPTVPHGMDRLSKVELVPFVQGIRRDVQGIMVAHLFMPELDKTKNRATTLSPKVVTQLLKDSLGFKGLIFTDALNMKGVASYYAPGEVDLEAFRAGNDVLLFSENVNLGIEKILQAVKLGEIPEARVEESCLKILKYKEKYGILKSPILEDTNNVDEVLRGKDARKLKRILFEHSITLLHKKEGEFPLSRVKAKNVLCIAVGADSKTAFQKTLDLYGRFQHTQVGTQITRKEIANLNRMASKADEVIIAIQTGSNKPNWNYGLQLTVRNLIIQLAKESKVHLAIFTNPYCLLELDHFASLSSVTVAYQNDIVVQDVMAQAFFGVSPFLGELPISIGTTFPRGSGIRTKSIFELGYAFPEELGVDPAKLKKIDALLENAVKRRATPGLRVMASRYGKVFYDESFGGYTYSLKNRVEASTVYDLASITKVMSTTAIAMQLHDEGKLDIQKTIGDYFPNLEDTLGYKDIVLADMMGHQAGLKSWIPFYQRWVDCDTCDLWRPKSNKEFDKTLARNMYTTGAMEDSLYKIILSTPFRDNTNYKYSDLGFFWMKKVIEKVEGKSLDQLFDARIKKPLGLAFTGYNPLKSLPSQWIAPTEFDAEFRKQLLQGHVHDPGAAFQNGVGGHAGLFATAPEALLIANAMLFPETSGLWKEATMNFFSSRQFENNDNRRGLGFDKPVLEPGPGPAFPGAPSSSFGHSGFTGTLFWADPATGLVVVFLSNRVYPTASNNLLAKKDYRSKTLQYFFESLEDWIPQEKGSSALGLVK
ncbi:MAG: beta-N-acetylhexosaminidase [Luteibaculaceae bacterium]|jgi:beta-N-acetylhexosaminidase